MCVCVVFRQDFSCFYLCSGMYVLYLSILTTYIHDLHEYPARFPPGLNPTKRKISSEYQVQEYLGGAG